MTRIVSCPPTNIVMPVFGRPDETLVSIASIREHSGPGCTLTVVDNGNEAAFGRELVGLARRRVIDHLFILDRNYGIACACNVGWNLVDAPFFMKIDNDYRIVSPAWLENIFGMWGKARHATLMGPAWNCAAERGRVETGHGILWTLPVSFVGSSFLVSRKIKDQIGVFCEDYGLYGEEDADYCLRCHHAGIRKLSFAPEPLMEIISRDEKEPDYAAFKRSAHEDNVGQGEGRGIFALNVFLYANGLRDLNVPLKYRVVSVRDRHVCLEENPAYPPFREKLEQCLALFNACDRHPGPSEIEAMRAILA